MRQKHALDCWVIACDADTIRWLKISMGSKTAYEGKCSSCDIRYEIGVTIGGGMTVSHEGHEKIQRLNDAIRAR